MELVLFLLAGLLSLAEGQSELLSVEYVIRHITGFALSFGFHLSTQYFTDRDNDRHTSSNCASLRQGAWWYRSCTDYNLNGKYLRGDNNCNGAWWGNFNTAQSCYSLKWSEMKLRQIWWTNQKCSHSTSSINTLFTCIVLTIIHYSLYPSMLSLMNVSNHIQYIMVSSIVVVHTALQHWRWLRKNLSFITA